MNDPTKHSQYKHGHALSTGISSTYEVWASMKKRCLNPKSMHYADYGGRGITICEKWLFFEGFLDDMGQRPKGMTLERIDNEKGYCKDNCKWATKIEQANNRRSNVYVEYKGRTQTLKTWALELGLNYKVLHQRINRDGWSIDRALSTSEPINNRKYLVEVDGRKQTLWQYCNGDQNHHDFITSRLRRGWSLEEAINLPKGVRRTS